MKNTAIYIRVSTNRQVQEGDSIAAQRDALRKYIDGRDDLVFAGEYMDDGISGTKYNQRDELQRLLDDVKEGKIEQILFTKLDRWFRSVRHYTSTQAVLDKYNVGWTAIWEPIYDTTTPQGRLIVNQMMSIAQFEAENTGQRIRQVQSYKVSQGEVISGSVPHGYSIVDKHLIPNEDAKNVVLAFETFARTGSLSKTLVEMADIPGLPRTTHNFKRLLKNTLYIGEYRGNLEYCEPIIPKQLFDDVQRLLPMNIKSNQRRTYLFSGLIRCGECGCSFAANTKKRSRTKSGREEISHIYRCPKRYQRTPPQCSNTKILTESVLEKYLLQNLNDMITQVTIEYTDTQKKQKSRADQITALNRKADRWKELFINGLVTLEEYKAAKDDLSQQIADIEDPAPGPDLTALKALQGQDIAGIYKSLTRPEKRRFWRGIVACIRFYGDRRIYVEFV